MHIGIIYKCLCLNTNKVYIGQTSRSLEARMKEHIRESFNEYHPSYNYHFHRAIRKYGKQNFEWSILETIRTDNADNLQEVLNSLEIKYIQQYDSYYNGYNSTLGGDSETRNSKEITAYFENGSVFGKYENSKHASQYFNVSQNVIWMICGRFQKYAITRFGRIIFRYENDNYLESEISEIKKDNRNKKVCSYDLKGTLLMQFNTIKEATEFYKVGRSQYISKNCSKKTAFVQCKDQRIIFRYDTEIPTREELFVAQIIKTDCKKCVKAIDFITGNFLGAFKTMSEAAKMFNTKGNKVSEVCSGKRKTSGRCNGHPVIYQIISYDEYEKLTR